ncbi:hypothetical protein DOH76_23775 [Salmonella enterica subsp. enterica serovar Oranienburg]|uniref:Uncharacterized protein n=1 Tax=Salmonella diarizonae TaxID=59204 RepID=A0A5Y1YEQ9_SALDZ|nr:hypothetical protein [Salmonella enterica subsp. enterica serovar Oranienburg]ECC3916790.1 hypothetical protein [Salmonella enterica subsp. diarizonae]
MSGHASRQIPDSGKSGIQIQRNGSFNLRYILPALLFGHRTRKTGNEPPFSAVRQNAKFINIPPPVPFLSVFLTGIYFRLNFLISCFYWFFIVGASRCGTLVSCDRRRDRKRIHSVALNKISPSATLYLLAMPAQRRKKKQCYRQRITLTGAIKRL